MSEPPPDQHHPADDISARADDAENEVPSDGKDDDVLRNLVKHSLRDAPEPPPQLLHGVQRKIRQRSRGKFYGDGWSIATGRAHYAIVALIMLALVATAYLALSPTALR